ncbi:MAG: hypothetical protein ABSD62_00005 [Candidatus Limnocylindrales bacterium]
MAYTARTWTDADTMAVIILVVVGIAGLALVAHSIFQFWLGERVRGLHPTNVSSLTAGRVVVTGNAEPAWAIASSPFGGLPCVWYDARSVRPARRWSGTTLFKQRNAVAFVVNDGSSRILVLGRRARWDPATGFLAKEFDAGEQVANQEGDSSAAISGPPEATPRSPAPPPLKSHWRRSWFGLGDPVSWEQIDAEGTERCVQIGERVTVTGQAIPYSPAVLKASDACPDGGQSLGLLGTYVIGPALVTGLDVLAGSPDDVKTRGRFNVELAVFGAIIAVVCAWGVVRMLG